MRRRVSAFTVLTLAALGACSSSSGTGASGAPSDAGLRDATTPDAAGPPDSGEARGDGSTSRMRTVVLTQLGDNLRTGINTSESFLSPTVVASSFGKLFTRAVDGDLYAQPLYVQDLPLEGGHRNVVFLATSHDSVYAYDADDPAASAPIWHVSVGQSVAMPNSYFGIDTSSLAACKGNKFNLRESGITSTPVIDLEARAIYVMALVQDASHMVSQTCVDVDTTSATYCMTATCDAPTFRYELHALDLFTGAEKPGSPTTIAATAAGTGAGSVNGVLTFDARLHLQRAGLLLANGSVYTAFASYGDLGDYHGWVVANDAKTLAQTAAFVDTPDGQQGGIWQSGHGLSADPQGNIYLATGNGTFDAQEGGRDYGDSVLKLDAKLHVLDWFTPTFSSYQGHNWLEEWDADLGSSGVMLVPGTNQVVIGGKQGTEYVLDSRHLGGFQEPLNSIQSFKASWRHNKTSCADGVGDSTLFGGAVQWASPKGMTMYVWGTQDFLKAYTFDANGLIPQAAAVCFCNASTFIVDPNCGAPASISTSYGGHGASLAVSSNGSAPGSAVVWAAHENGNADAWHSTVPGVLEAYDGTDVSKLLWNSLEHPVDDLGNWAKFTSPVIANGKVYMASFSNQLVVYGVPPL